MEEFRMGEGPQWNSDFINKMSRSNSEFTQH